MGCQSLRDPVTGRAVRVNSDGTLPAQTRPVAWTPTASSSVAVDGSETSLVGSVTGRVYIRFTNNGSVDLFVRPGEHASTSDTKIAAGQSMEFQGGYAGAWTGITGGTSVQVAIIEFTG
jgi:hypothetical protein